MKPNEAVQRAVKVFRQTAYKWLTEAQHGYLRRRKAFNIQRAPKHPATLSASRRGKLRRT